MSLKIRKIHIFQRRERDQLFIYKSVSKSKSKIDQLFWPEMRINKVALSQPLLKYGIK